MKPVVSVPADRAGGRGGGGVVVLFTEGGEGGVWVVLLAEGVGCSWSAEMRAARVAALVVLKRAVKSAARVGGWSAMICGGDDDCVVSM